RTLLFNVTSPPEMHALSLHDALPILAAGDDADAHVGWRRVGAAIADGFAGAHALHGDHGAVQRHRRLQAELRGAAPGQRACAEKDRKSTRLNSSHVKISYAVFCLKKK